MLKEGLVEEVRSLLAAGYSPELPSLSAIGYRQIVEYLQGKIDISEAAILMKRRTRQFVRRQANWFKLEDPDIQWFQAELDVIKDMEFTIRAFLGSFYDDSVN